MGKEYGLVVVGRGIEQVVKKKLDGSLKIEWRPTSYIKKVQSPRNWNPLRVKGVTPFDEDAMVAGANVNAFAAAVLIDESLKRGDPPRIVIFAAGRPDYLAQYLAADPTLSEGRALKEKFGKLIHGKFRGETTILSDNVDSFDDIVASLELAKKLNLEALQFVTVAVHHPRLTDLVDLAVALNPKLAAVNTQIFDSESIVLRRDARFGLIFDKVLDSPAFRGTKQVEEKGRRQLREGGYSFKSKHPSLQQYPKILQLKPDLFRLDL